MEVLAGGKFCKTEGHEKAMRQWQTWNTGEKKGKPRYLECDEFTEWEEFL